MAEITAQAVNEFRKRTGLGLMECKSLLKEADGDLKKAEILAKERGLKNAEKRSGRAATAGRVDVFISPDAKLGALIELGCETDFVARNEEFRQAAKEMAEHVAHSPEGDTLEQKSRKDASKSIREVLVELKAPPQQLFADSAPPAGAANYLRFRLSPNSAIALAARVKRPGKEFVGDQRELYLLDEQPGEEAPYERLLGDAMAGNGALFIREDAVEAAWAVVDPVLRNHHRVRPYQRHSWGPKDAGALIAGQGTWHNPVAGRT